MASADQNHTTIPTLAQNDSLLMGLAAAYRTACDARNRAAAASLLRHMNMHDWRANVLLSAIAAIPADSLAGATIQAEALDVIAQWDCDGAEEMRMHLHASVYGALARATGRTSADGLAEIEADDDPFSADIAALQAFQDAAGPDGAATLPAAS